MRVISALVLVLALAAPAGCGGAASVGSSSAQSSPKMVLISSADATRKAGSARFSVRVAMSTGGQSLMTMTGGGVVQFAPSLAAVTLRFSAGSMLGSLDGMSMTQMVIGRSAYIRSPLFAGLTGSGKPWVKIDLDALGGDGNPVDLSSGQGDPSQVLDYLRGVTSSVTRVGEDEVRGVEATHYRAVVSLEKALAGVPAADRKRLEAASKAMGASAMPIDIWVDGDGRVRRVQLSTDMATGGQTMHMDVRVEYYDFGTDVKVQTPPASQVADLTGLGESLSAG